MNLSRFRNDTLNIPWPGDRRRQEIAERAGVQCFYRFPYFALRFGERGHVFAVRDAGFLLTLHEHPPGQALEQIDWLVSVLANRGMPSWLMEVQLAILARSAARAGLPFDLFQDARDRIAERRRRYVSDADMRAAGERFASTLELPGNRRVREAGMLVASAYADEQNDIAPARAFLEWMTDGERFPPVWCEAVSRCYREAGRKSAKPRGSRS